MENKELLLVGLFSLGLMFTFLILTTIDQPRAEFKDHASAFEGVKKGIPPIPEVPDYIKDAAPIKKSPITNKEIGRGKQ